MPYLSANHGMISVVQYSLINCKLNYTEGFLEIKQQDFKVAIKPSQSLAVLKRGHLSCHPRAWHRDQSRCHLSLCPLTPGGSPLSPCHRSPTSQQQRRGEFQLALTTVRPCRRRDTERLNLCHHRSPYFSHGMLRKRSTQRKGAATKIVASLHTTHRPSTSKPTARRPGFWT